MNYGQEHPSAAIRALTDERFLAAYRAIVMVGLSVVGFFLVRLVSSADESERKMEAFRITTQAQVTDIKIDVARNTANSIAAVSAIQSRMDAQSRRLDGVDIDIRDVNRKLYEGRAK